MKAAFFFWLVIDFGQLFAPASFKKSYVSQFNALDPFLQQTLIQMIYSVFHSKLAVCLGSVSDVSLLCTEDLKFESTVHVVN